MREILLCRTCKSPDIDIVLDLGQSPVANRYTSRINPGVEPFYDLAIALCNKCKVVQTSETLPRESIFDENYAYFSSTSKSWLEHSKLFASQVCERFSITEGHTVVEIASNDGYLLQYFKELGVKTIGVEPTLSTARVALAKDIFTIIDFFGETRISDLREQGLSNADLLIANNVLAHVPDLIDFTRGLKGILNEQGVISVEFQYVLPLVQNNAFDTIYHEHYSYFSVLALQPLFKSAGLRIFDIDDISTHGGSIRVYACHELASFSESDSVLNHINDEISAGLESVKGFEEMQQRTKNQKVAFLEFLREHKNSVVCGYGAAAKGNTFLNYCQVGNSDIQAVFDAAEAKQGLLLPGSKIPILSPRNIREIKPEFLIVLPWNISDEIIKQTSFISEWGGRHVLAMPTLQVI